MKHLKGTILTMLALSLQAVAQEPGHLNVTTTVHKEEVSVNESGEAETQLVAASNVVPGESVIYTITFQNISDEPAEDVVITNPISKALTYVDGSAFGPGSAVQFSIDGGQNFAAANDLTVTEDGELRPAGPDDFTHIRWVMNNDLAVGEQGTARFSAVLK